MAGLPGAPGPTGAEGPMGLAGATGPIGPTGPAPIIAVDGGLIGDGSAANPLAIDPSQRPSRLEGSRIFEAEDPVSASTVAGVIQSDATASGGKVRFGAASSPTPGTLWRVEKAQAGSLLGISRSLLTVRVKITNNLSTGSLAEIGCAAIRSGTTAFVSAGGPSTIRPSEFSNLTWREMDVLCDFRPDDVDQAVFVNNFAVTVTDLSVDYARVTPLTPTLSSSSTPPWNLVYEETFDNGNAPGWNQSSIIGCGAYPFVLGNFGVGVLANVTLTSLPPHTQLRVRSRYMHFDSWDGEVGRLTVDNVLRWQSKPYNNCCSGTNLCLSGSYPDRVTDLDLEFLHTGNSVTLSFSSSLDSTAVDESFGVDEVHVYVR